MTPPLAIPDPRDVEQAVAEAIAHEAALLRTGPNVNAVAVLRAIAEMETNGGARWGATLHESAYCYGGSYYKAQTPGGQGLRDLSVPWGCLAHQSFGPWQVLFVTAWENGFRGDPVALRDPAVSAPVVVAILNRRVGDTSSAPQPEDFFRAWNGGNLASAAAQPYADKALQHYHRFMGDAIS